QVAQASFAHAVQHDARTIPRKVEPGSRLSDGGPELCGGTLATCQADGIRPATTASEIANVQLTPAIAERASRLMPSTIERNPFERCGVRCSRMPMRSNIATASVSSMSLACLPE